MTTYAQPNRNPGTAALLSFFVPGIGQIYAGKVGNGLAVLFILMPILWFLGLGLAPFTGGLTLLLPFAGWILQILDAKKMVEADYEV